MLSRGPSAHNRTGRNRTTHDRTLGAIIVLIIAAFAIATTSVRDASAIDDRRELVRLKKNGAPKNVLPKNVVPKNVVPKTPPKGTAVQPGPRQFGPKQFAPKQFGNTVPGAKQLPGHPGAGPKQFTTNNPAGAAKLNPTDQTRAVTGATGDGKNLPGRSALSGKNPPGKDGLGKGPLGKGSLGKDRNTAVSKLGNSNAGFGKGPAGKNAVGPNGLGRNGFGRNGAGPNGLGPNGLRSNGLGPNARFPGGRAANFPNVHSRIANSRNVFEQRRLVAQHQREVLVWRQLMPRRPLPFERGFTGVPPVGETRFVSSEVMFQAGPNVSPQAVDAAARRLGLAVIDSRASAVTGGTVYRFRVAGGRPVGDVLRSLETENIGFGTPNYTYVLNQEPDADANAETNAGAKPETPPDGKADAKSDDTQSDAQSDAKSDLAAKAGIAAANGQYVVSKLRLGEVHQVATGSNVLIAVIDSKIDINHPDLAGTVVEQFDATGQPEQPHTHGTGMVGAIAAHQRLMGIAPNARILAVSAFSTSTRQSPEATTRNILAGLDWAISKGARVINMSFAGPYDPMLQLAMKNAAAKGVVLIAASGNSGPRSPPLYPAADPNVIAVTATDENDKLFPQAVRGSHIAVAAPGVDIMVPAPENTYQITTGTSVAAAHVSGVAALLIERYPNVDAETVLEVLTSSAKHLNPNGRDDGVGWGLIDPASALAELDARMAAGSQVASPARPTPAPPKPTAAKQITPKQGAPKPASATTGAATPR